jgi:hypothetical protein
MIKLTIMLFFCELNKEFLGNEVNNQVSEYK